MFWGGHVFNKTHIRMDYGLTKWTSNDMPLQSRVGCLCWSTEKKIWQQPINFCSGEDIIFTRNWDTAINCTITCNMKVLLNKVPMICVGAIMTTDWVQTSCFIKTKMGAYPGEDITLFFNTNYSISPKWTQSTNSAPILTIQPF